MRTFSATPFVTALFCLFGLAHGFAHYTSRDKAIENGYAGDAIVGDRNARNTEQQELNSAINMVDDFSHNNAGVRRVLSSENPAPLRIVPVYQIAGVSQEMDSFVRNTLIPVSTSQVARYVSVRRPVEGQLYLFSGSSRTTWCNDVPTSDACMNAVCKDPRSGSGYSDADFVLYVTITQNANCIRNDMIFASASPCMFDPDSDRPLAGLINFCPKKLQVASQTSASDIFGHQLDVAVHEIFHALAFFQLQTPMFVADDGKTKLGVNNVIATSTSWSGAVKRVITPTVVRVAKDHFKCDSLTGVELENNGGNGTIWSHWEARVVGDEIMAGSANAAARAPVSNLTLALLEDSGWYRANFSNAGYLRWGNGAGCAFLNADCRTPPANNGPPYWCSAPSSSPQATCAPDYLAVGSCLTNPLFDGCARAERLATGGECQDASQQTVTDTFFGKSFGLGNRCLPAPSGETWTKINTNGDSQLSLNGYAGCYQVSCKNATDALRLYVTVSDCPNWSSCAVSPSRSVMVECPEGGYISLPSLGLGFASGRIGPCPAPYAICSGWGCPLDCSGNRGVCLNPTGIPGAGVCKCYSGYTGPGCNLAETIVNGTLVLAESERATLGSANRAAAVRSSAPPPAASGSRLLMRLATPAVKRARRAASAVAVAVAVVAASFAVVGSCGF